MRDASTSGRAAMEPAVNIPRRPRLRQVALQISNQRLSRSDPGHGLRVDSPSRLAATPEEPGSGSVRTASIRARIAATTCSGRSRWMWWPLSSTTWSRAVLHGAGNLMLEVEPGSVEAKRFQGCVAGARPSREHDDRSVGNAANRPHLPRARAHPLELAVEGPYRLGHCSEALRQGFHGLRQTFRHDSGLVITNLRPVGAVGVCTPAACMCWN